MPVFRAKGPTLECPCLKQTSRSCWHLCPFLQECWERSLRWQWLWNMATFLQMEEKVKTAHLLFSVHASLILQLWGDLELLENFKHTASTSFQYILEQKLRLYCTLGHVSGETKPLCLLAYVSWTSRSYFRTFETSFPWFSQNTHPPKTLVSA